MDRAHPLPPRDPISGGPLVITEVEAVESGVTIRGRFEVPRFARLSPDQAKYLETFLRCRGMLNSVEKELGISYPTARARLDAVLKALDLHAVREDAAPASAEFQPLAEESVLRTSEALGEDAGLPSSVHEEAANDAAWFEEDSEPTSSFDSSEPEEPEEPADESPRYSREEILTMLERGEISVEDVKKELGRTR